MEQIPFLRRLTVRLTGGVIFALLLVGFPFFLAFHSLLREQQVEAMSEATTALSRIVVDGLRSSMLAGRPHLLDESVRSLSRNEGVERVLILDHRGKVRVSSDRAYDGQVLDRERDITCSVCHRPDRTPPPSRTAVTVEKDRRVLRAMSAIANEPRCHACHDAGAPINGILLMDLTLSSADRRFFANIGSTLGLGIVMVVVTITVLVLLLRRMVHSPLQAIVATTRRITEGKLDERVTIAAPGEFSLLASRLNSMTHHLSRSLRTVEDQRRELQAILDSVDDEIVVLDREQRVVAANKAFQKKVGQIDLDIQGRFCRDVASAHWPCAADQPGGCPVQKVYLSGSLQKGIISSRDPDGKERYIEIHASPLFGADGTVAQAVEVRRDISERRQMEAVLAHSEHMAALGLLASGISHEINNPLGAIATSVEGLRRRIPRDPGISAEATGALEAALQRVAREVQRGRTITDRLLRVARAPGVTRTLVDVNRVAEDIVAILAHDINSSRVVATLDLAPDLPPLRWDESHVGQIVMNLTLNAIQAMAGGGGRLRISTSASDGGLRIEVEDSGCGIAPELLRRIYEPFFTTKPPGKGTGLGLFITHRIVTDMEGTIQVKSRLGQGTLFTIWLPLDDARSRS